MPTYFVVTIGKTDTERAKKYTESQKVNNTDIEPNPSLILPRNAHRL